MPEWRPPLTAMVAAAATAACQRLLASAQPGGPPRWTRANHTGRPVTLLEGPAFVSGTVAAALVPGGSPAAALAAAGAAGLGLLDDLAGDQATKGVRGHLRALRRGELSTGVVKLLGLSAAGLLAAVVADAGPCRPGVTGSPAARAARTMLGAGVVAGSANLLNLLDLRPGRALKVTLLWGTPLAVAGSTAAAAAVGAAFIVLPADLAARSMLGDTGANGAGALLGVAVVERTGWRGRLGVLVMLAALTAASEVISFTTVIESTPGLRELDAWGRG